MFQVEFRRFAPVCAAFSLLFVSTIATRVQGEETEHGTRQFAVAVGFQNQKLYESAIDEWKTFLQKFPQDSRVDKATHYLGTCQLQAKQLPAAAATFESVLQKYPKFELLDQTVLNLGTAWYSQAQESRKPEDYAKAEVQFARLAKDFPQSPYAGRALYYGGESQYQQNKLDEAAASYAALTNTFPKDELVPDATYALGICQESLKKTDDALATFTAFESRFPQHALLTEVKMRHAELLVTGGKFDQAQGLFAQVSSVKEFPLADTAMLRQARCLYELKKYDEAGRLYWNVPRQFAQSKHYDTAVLAGAKCYYLTGKYAHARSGLENVAKRNVPEAAEASQWIGRSLLKEKNPQEALKVLDAAIAKHGSSPAFPQLVLARIDALYELPERRAETVPLYAEFAQKYPQDELAAQAQYMSALTALEIDNHAAAKANSDAFAKQFPNDALLPDVLFIGAEASLLLREFKDAEQLYRDFLTRAPQHANAAQARVRLGLALQLDGRNEDALKELESTLTSLSDPALKSEALAITGRCHVAEKQLDKAAGAFEQSLATKPDRPQSDQTLLALADIYRRLERASDSAARLEQLKREFPKSPLAEEATFRLGEAAYAQNAFDQAINQYSVVVSTWPDGTFAPHAQYGLGWSHFKKQDFAKSVEATKTLADRYGKNELAPKGMYVRAMAQYQLGQFPAAVDDVRAFLSSNPPQKDALDAEYLLGLSFAAQQKFADAAQAYAGILAKDPKYSDADKVLYELGWAHFELTQKNESIAAFRRLGTEFPDSPLAAESWFRVGESYYDAGEFAEAVKAYSEAQAKAAAAASPDIGEKAAHKRGWSFLKANDFAEASSAFESQLTAYPGGTLSGDAEFLLGECLYKQKQWQPALKHYASVIAANHPTYSALAFYRSGECAAALEQWEESARFHQQALDGFPEFELKPEARYGVGWALQQQNKLAEAIPYYERVTEETETETAAKARFMIGECFFAQKNHKEATKHFLKAAFAYGHKEWSAMAWFEAARCFEVLQDVAQAKNCYQQMIDKFPDHPNGADAKKRLGEF
ncbi:MAG: tetratricopeptide repeat protein [Planctomycetaceae bacterium]